jgi:hypothetical protein
MLPHLASRSTLEGRSMEVLLVFLLALVAVTVVGHGIWLLMAALVRSVQGPRPEPAQRPGPAPSRKPSEDVCPGCEAQLLSWQQTCPRCGLDQGGTVARQLRDLVAARRVVARLVSGERLAGATASLLAETFLAERRRLLGDGQGRQPRPVRTEARPAPPVEEEILDAIPVDEVPPPAPRPPSPIAAPAPGPVSPALTPVALSVAPAPPPRRPLTNVLAAFMEERNILWGELVGGLLIVGCSIALVLTLWNSLQQLPYFPVLLLGGLTAALYGAGQYTLHHWKLESTSRGLLVIAVLLAPLELLLLADPSARGPNPLPDWLPPTVAIAAVAVFTLLVRGAARDLIGQDVLPGPLDRRWLLALAVAGTAGSQLLTPALLAGADEGVTVPLLLGLAVLPGLCYLGSTGAVLAGLGRHVRRGAALTVRQAHALFAFLGLAVFALLAALAFLLTRDPQALEHLPALAVPLALAGIPGLVGGLFVHRRLGEDSAGTRTAGTAVALGGLALMLAGVGLAWPQPGPLFLVALLDGLVLTLAAFRGRAGFLHAGGLPCLVLAVLLCAQFVSVGWDLPAEEPAAAWLAGQLVSARSGLVLAGLAAVLTSVSLLLGRWRGRAEALPFVLATVAVGALALVVATGHGLEQPLAAAAVHVLVGLAALGASLRAGRHALAQVGAWLLLPAALWALHGLLPDERAAWGTVLAGEALVLVLVGGWMARRTAPQGQACRTAGAAAGILAAGLALLSGAFPAHVLHPVTAAGLAVVAFVLAGQLRQRLLAALGSLLVLGSLVLVFEYHLPVVLARPAAAALLVHATLAVLVTRWLASRMNSIVDTFVQPVRLTAQAGSFVAFALLLMPGDELVGRALYALWSAGLWLESAWRRQSPAWFTLFQAGLSVAGLLAARAVVDATGIFADLHGELDPRLLQAHGVVLGGLGLLWVALGEVRPVQALYPANWPGLDRVVLAGVVLGQLALALLYAWPGLVVEWSPRVALADFPWWHAEAAGPAAWLCLAVTAAAVVATLRQAVRGKEEIWQIASLAGVLVLAAGAVVLWATGHAGDRATASALRWGFATVFVVGSALAWLRRGATRSALVPYALLAVLACSVFLLSAVAAVQGFARLPRGGPEVESLFASVGFTLSHLGPLVLLVAGLAGTALCERSSGYAFVACQLACVSVAAGYALGLPALDTGAALFLCLLVVQTASAGTLLWLLARRIPAGVLLGVQAWLGMLVLATVALLPLSAWLVDPGRTIDLAYHVLGRPGGWLALGLAGTACLLHARRHDPRRQPAVLGVLVLLAGVLAGCMALRWEKQGSWMAWHSVRQTWAGLGLIVVVAGSLARRETMLRLAGGADKGVIVWLAVLGSALTLGALRSGGDPNLPWVAGGAALMASVVLAMPAVWFGRGGFAFPSGLVFCLVGMLVWWAWAPGTLAGFVLVVALGLALASAAWSLPWLPADARPFTRLAAPAALLLAVAAVGLTLAGDLAGARVTLPDWLGWLALAAVGLALVVQPSRALARPCLYVLSLAAVGLGLHGLGLASEQLPWATGLALALHATAIAYLAARFPDEADRERAWLLPVQLVAGSVVVLLGVWACLTPAGLLERLSGPVMLLLLAPGGWLLAGTGHRQGERLGWLAPAALAAALAALAWAVPADQTPLAWLVRDAWLLVALAVVAVVYLEVRGDGSRLAAVRPVGLVLFGLAVLAALIVAVQMIPLFDRQTRRTPLPGPAVLAVLAALVALVVAAVRLALSARPDPLGLGQRGRMTYVYLAELLLVLVFVHVRLNVPELFVGALVRYWMLLVMGLAFVAVGAAEWFDRRGLRVLAVPLVRTGVFLPLVPLLSFWARPPAALMALAHERAPGLVPFLSYLEGLHWHYDMHALIWFLAGALFLVLALSRRSRGWALAGAVAANFGLWAIWMHAGVAFLSHPQVWLIPVGLIVLVAEYINRKDLSDEVAVPLRYLGVSLIYVASTADLFIDGVGNSLWLPVVLAVLCVAGVLAGIWLRVRAFLFLGVGFLLVDVGTMIWHAAVHRAHTWVWWASGIVLGVAILALFAVFEKRRNDVLRLVDELRRWH